MADDTVEVDSAQLSDCLCSLGIYPPHPTRLSLKRINKAFKKIALSVHPDKNPNNPKASADFVRIKAAYDSLLSASASRRKTVHTSKPAQRTYQRSDPTDDATYESPLHKAAFSSFRKPTMDPHKCRDDAECVARPSPRYSHRDHPYGRSSNDRSSCTNSRPRWYTGSVEHWGESCGECDECRALAGISKDTLKKREILKGFQDVSVAGLKKKKSRRRPR